MTQRKRSTPDMLVGVLPAAQKYPTGHAVHRPAAAGNHNRSRHARRTSDVRRSGAGATVRARWTLCERDGALHRSMAAGARAHVCTTTPPPTSRCRPDKLRHSTQHDTLTSARLGSSGWPTSTHRDMRSSSTGWSARCRCPPHTLQAGTSAIAGHRRRHCRRTCDVGWRGAGRTEVASRARYTQTHISQLLFEQSVSQVDTPVRLAAVPTPQSSPAGHAAHKVKHVANEKLTQAESGSTRRVCARRTHYTIHTSELQKHEKSHRYTRWRSIGSSTRCMCPPHTL